ncbi:hypothetical protein VKT23_011150 [Stygiomarasmius scandens]|uniref:Uncharacterized protein n=1 Tax=Marasmiellus scandens TaxID=2682957 RepID=A0ABR1JAZ1_9AGAR
MPSNHYISLRDKQTYDLLMSIRDKSERKETLTEAERALMAAVVVQLPTLGGPRNFTEVLDYISCNPLLRNPSPPSRCMTHRGELPYHPSYGPYSQYNFDWLKLLYWDTTHDRLPREWTFQLCARESLPSDPLNLKAEGVTLYTADMAGVWHIAGPRHIPVCLQGKSIRVSYPVQRGNRKGPQTVIILTLPVKRMEGEERRVFLEIGPNV